MVNIQNTLNAWQQELHPFRIDIVGDYAGRELFLIEGDSLLRLSFGDKRIDMEDGFQLLHCVYVVESFLENLRKRGCNFHLVFFDENNYISIPSRPDSANNACKYLFARSAIIQHLSYMSKAGIRTGDNTFHLHQFQSPYHDHFQQYLADTRPYFVMCHDSTDKPIKEVKFILRGFVWRMVMAGYNVAWINTVEFRDSKVISAIVQGGPTLRITDFQVHVNASYKLLVENSPFSLEYDYDFPEVPTSSVLSERELMAVASVSALIENSDFGVIEEPYVATFLLHIALLNHLSLPQRHIEYTPDPLASELLEEIFQQIVVVSWRFLGQESYRQAATQLQKNIHDFVDGRLLKNLQNRLDNGKVSLQSLPQIVLNDFTRITKAIEVSSGYCISLPSQIKNVSEYHSRLESSQNPAIRDTELAVLPFSNSTFDKFLSPIKLAIDSSAAAQVANNRNRHSRELSLQYHRKPVSMKHVYLRHPGLKRSTNKWAAGKARRSEQFLFSEMTRYAASLVGSKGKILEPVIITNGPPPNLQLNTKQKQLGKPSGKKEKKPMSKKDTIRAENSKKLSEKGDLTLRRMWQTLHGDIQGVTDELVKILQLDQFLDKINSTLSEKGQALSCEVRIYKIWVLQRIWIDYCRKNQKDDGYEVTARIFNEAKELLTSPGLTKKAYQILSNVFGSLGISMPPRTSPEPLLDSKLFLTAPWDGTALGDTELQMTSTEFQLLHCGPYMNRNMDSKPDPRVAFEPDGWQRKVLDEIDQDNSVFVVAPTSAGKTFISFYAMEKILRSGNDDVLVYVAPNKALVNQVAAEVMARFRKQYAHAGKSVWAIHTRDRRIGNSTGCQILVTVPHILQIMLLSPSNAKSWSTRVKRIIFDEIHCIGQVEDGVVWEQLIILSPCPIIALSATVGNPEEFSSWMESTQRSLGIELKTIKHHHRYSDLRKIFYNPPKSYTFTGLGTERRFPRLESSRSFVPMHPIASLVDFSRGIPEDLALEPRDCLSLYQTMEKKSTGKYPIEKKLNPERFFAKSPIIRKVDVIKWEIELKKVLQHWMDSPDSPFQEVVRGLMGTRVEESTNMDQIGQLAISSVGRSRQSLDEAVEAASNLPTLLKTTLPLLDELNRKNALPAIVFSFDRGICEILCHHVVKQLISAESAWRQTDVEWNTTLRKWKEYKAEKQTRSAKKQAKISARNREGTKEEQMREKATEGLNFFDTFNPNAPSPQFSFADNSKHSYTELMSSIAFLSRFSLPPGALSALRRGIGIHHSGLNRHYRQEVEILFRKGYLRIVIATGTLSLGINMPCKTVIFAGDSIWLTSLAFRQSAGRAGRRGFDNLGNVIFLGIPLGKARRLISSRLPSLMGHFPITTSLVLRLFILLNGSNDSEYAKRAIGGLLSQPRLYLGGDTFKEQVLHHLRFSIEFLRRQNLLGYHGEPLHFAGLTGHLYYTENSSFAFHALLQSGFFNSLCAKISVEPDKTCIDLMHVLANLFGRHFCRRTDMRKLRPLPLAAALILEKHNSTTLRVYTNYVKTFAAEYCKDTNDNVLPFSHGVCGGRQESANTNPESTTIPPLSPVIARSSFVALSGLDDKFISISDLSDSVRAGIFLEKAAVPYLDTSDDVHLNSYLLDFYRHGEKEKLVIENNIRRSDMWFLFNDFSLILATIITSLKNLIACKSDDDAFDVAGLGDIEDFKIGETPSDAPDIDTDEDSSVEDYDSELDFEDDEAGLINVLAAFEIVKVSFDRNFKAMWS